MRVFSTVLRNSSNIISTVRRVLNESCDHNMTGGGIEGGFNGINRNVSLYPITGRRQNKTCLVRRRHFYLVGEQTKSNIQTVFDVTTGTRIRSMISDRRTDSIFSSRLRGGCTVPGPYFFFMYSLQLLRYSKFSYYAYQWVAFLRTNS